MLPLIILFTVFQFGKNEMQYLLSKKDRDLMVFECCREEGCTKLFMHLFQ